MKTLIENGRTQLIADDGMVITNGTDIYGTDITLAIGSDPKQYYEITAEDYEQKMKADAEIAEIEGG